MHYFNHFCRMARSARALYAADKVKSRKIETAADYIRRATDSIIAVRGRMATCRTVRAAVARRPEP
jgi:hypothetical protein